MTNGLSLLGDCVNHDVDVETKDPPINTLEMYRQKSGCVACPVHVHSGASSRTGVWPGFGKDGKEKLLNKQSRTLSILSSNLCYSFIF